MSISNDKLDQIEYLENLKRKLQESLGSNEAENTPIFSFNEYNQFRFEIISQIKRLKNGVNKISLLFSNYPSIIEVQSLFNEFKSIFDIYIEKYYQIIKLPFFKQHLKIIKNNNTDLTNSILAIINDVISNLRDSTSNFATFLVGVCWEKCDIYNNILPESYADIITNHLTQIIYPIEDSVSEFNEYLVPGYVSEDNESYDENSIILLKKSLKFVNKMYNTLKLIQSKITNTNESLIDNLFDKIYKYAGSVDDFLSSFYLPFDQDEFECALTEFTTKSQDIIQILNENSLLTDDLYNLLSNQISEQSHILTGLM